MIGFVFFEIFLCRAVVLRERAVCRADVAAAAALDAEVHMVAVKEKRALIAVLFLKICLLYTSDAADEL